MYKTVNFVLNFTNHGQYLTILLLSGLHFELCNKNRLTDDIYTIYVQ